MNVKLAVLLLATASGCAAPRYLAKVDGSEVTGDDLKREFKRRHAGHAAFLVDEQTVRTFVERLVDYRLLVLEAYRLGVDDEPELQREVERFRRTKLLAHMAKVELDAKAQVSPEEIQQVYDTKLLEILNVRQLVVPTREEAEAIRAQAVGGADFETLVRERSTASSRKRGGFLELGWGSLTPEREAIVFALSDGALSPVMEMKDGFEILQVIARVKPEKKPDFAVASDRIGYILRDRKKNELKKQLATALWAKYEAKIEPFDATAEALRAAQDANPPSAARAATWKGGQILLRDLAATLKLDALAELPPETARREIRNALDNMVDPELLTLEAKARGYADLPEIAQPVNVYRDGLVANRFEGEFLQKSVAVTDDEARQYYEKNQARFVAPEERHVAHVVVEKPETADEVARKIAAGESFESLARAYSKDTESGKRGGALAWVKADEAKGELAAVFAVGEGAITKPIKTSFGYHVFKVLEIKPERPRAFEEVKPECVKRALSAKIEAKRADWIARLRAGSRIVVSTEGIRKFVADNPVDPQTEAKSLSQAMGGGNHGGPGMPGAMPPAQATPSDGASPTPAATPGNAGAGAAPGPAGPAAAAPEPAARPAGSTDPGSAAGTPK